MSKKRLDRFFCIVFVFFLLYAPPILNINMIYVLDIVGIAFVLISSLAGNKIIIDKFSIKLIVVFLLLTAFEIIVGFINGFGLYDSINDLLIILFGFVFCSIFLRNYCIQKKITNEDLMDILFSVALLQSLFCVIAYLSPDFQQWFINKMISYGYSDTRFSQLSSFRWYGMASQLGYATPVVQTILALFSMYRGILGEKKYYIYTVILLFSAIINARISVILFAVGIICIFLALLKKHGSNTFVKRLLTILCVGLIFSIIILSIMKKVSYANYKWLVNGLLAFIGVDVNLEGVYEVGNYFFDVNNMQLPKGASFLIGYGAFPYRLDAGFKTDIGFINDIWKYGIVVTFVMYYCILKMLNRLKFVKEFSDGFYKNIWIAFLFISNIKGIVVAATPLFCLLIVLLCAFPSYDYVGVTEYEK